MWRRGKIDGKGTMTFPNGTSREGEWREGKRLRWLDWTPKGSNENSTLFRKEVVSEL